MPFGRRTVGFLELGVAVMMLVVVVLVVGLGVVVLRVVAAL